VSRVEDELVIIVYTRVPVCISSVIREVNPATGDDMSVAICAGGVLPGMVVVVCFHCSSEYRSR
jgi:hypothetical protein